MKSCNCFYDVQCDGEEMRIILCGEIDHHNAVSVRGEIDALLCEKKPKRVVLDLSEIGFMDSSGLGLIMGRYSLMQKIGGELILENPNERVIKIFELAGLGRIIKIQNCKEEKIK